jgi:hypothetical protein
VAIRPNANLKNPVVGPKNETTTYTIAASFRTPKGSTARESSLLDPGYLAWVDKITQINAYCKHLFHDLSKATYAE